MHIPDLSSKTYEPSMHTGVDARSVGWLGGEVENVGPVALELVQAMRHFSQTCYHSDGHRGVHSCQVCKRGKRPTSHGEFWIECDGIRYVLPMMIFHYIEAHQYLPPTSFLEALQRTWVKKSR